MKAITERAQQALLQRLRETSLDEVERASIRAALERIVEGTYGECEICGGPIGRQRLAALPETIRCVGCSQKPSRPET